MDSSSTVNDKLIRKNSIEYREYQKNLAQQAIEENCLVVLPTGLGKTTVALQVISEYLSRKKGGVLFLAPTRVLSNQHYEFLRDHLIIDDIALVTGEDSLKKRKKHWINSVICATPEITKNDLERNVVDPKQFDLVIFDEAHRTVGDYAYSFIASVFSKMNVRIMGMTATLPSEKEKATDILSTLNISGIAQRSEQSPDVRPYVKQTDTEWVQVELPQEMKEIQHNLRRCLDAKIREIRQMGVAIQDTRSLTQLLRVKDYVLYKNRKAAKPLFTAIRVIHALSSLEAHGITPFLKFCERTRGKKGVGIKELFEQDTFFIKAVYLANKAKDKGIEHSKISKLAEIIKNSSGKVLIFSSYRDSVDTIHKKLTELGFSAGFLIGKAGETGLKQKKQVETVQKFREGECNILIATRVGEEGLDISEVNLVIFYDNVPSSIRYIQRKGRTGRTSIGRLVVLIAKDTTDETYYWIGKRKMKAANDMKDKMSKMLSQKQNTLEFSNKENNDKGLTKVTKKGASNLDYYF